MLDGVVRGRTVVVLGTANEPMPMQSMAEISPHIRKADVLVTSPALQVSWPCCSYVTVQFDLSNSLATAF